MTFYLNSTNSHYHLKGLIKDILPESRGFISMMIDFRNQSTVTSVHSILYTLHGLIDSNTTVPFDIDTGYTQAQQNRFQYLKALIAWKVREVAMVEGIVTRTGNGWHIILTSPIVKVEVWFLRDTLNKWMSRKE